MLGVVPGNKKLNGRLPSQKKLDKNGREKDVLKHIILKNIMPPDKLYSTSVINQTLDPEWDETFRL